MVQEIKVLRSSVTERGVAERATKQGNTIYFEHSFLHFKQVVQEIKVLRSSVTAHEREVAERATLVTQERLIKSKVCYLLCLAL